MNICSPEKKISRLVSVKPYQRKLKSLKPNPRSLGGKILPLPSLPKYRLKVKALGANSSLYATFQWCVGGQCVGNVPIYAHQSFWKPNTEKWTKGQDFHPFFLLLSLNTSRYLLLPLLLPDSNPISFSYSRLFIGNNSPAHDQIGSELKFLLLNFLYKRITNIKQLGEKNWEVVRRIFHLMK